MPNNFLDLSIDDLTTQSKANNNLSSNLGDTPDFLSQSISDLGVADIPPKEVPKDLPVNAESYDITGLMGRLVPKVAEKPPVPATRKGLVETTSEEDFFAPPEPKYGPKRNMPKGFKEVDMPEHFISKDDERSFVSSLVDNVHRLFTSKAEELAKATFQISLANDMGVRPSDISPDLLDAFKAGYGGSIFGLISQIERETKYPKTPIPEHLNAAQIASSGFGSVAGDILPFMAFSRAGVDPVSQMMAGFAGTQGLRAYYAHKLDKGEVSSPREFVDVLKGVVPETLKGAATGTATGWAGKVAAPLGPMSKVGAEAVAMTTVGSIVEGQFPTIQDFVNSAILLVGIHNIAKAPAVAGKIKTMWVKTGRKPADIIEDAKVDPKVAEVILNDGDIPEDVIAKAQAKVDVAEKIQAELAIKAELAKKETNPEEIVKKELAIKGKKVQEIKSGKKGFFEDPFGNQAEIDIITEASVKKGLSEFKKARRSDPIIMTKEEAKKRGLYESDEPVETGIDMLEQSIEDIKPGTINKPAKKVAKKTKKISSPEPITDLDLQTGTPLPKELSTQAHPFRDKNVEHTNTMRKIMQEKVNKADASPELFTRYLINEVNRYLNGEDVNIEKVRFGLSEVASRADNLRLKFDNPEDFDVWRNTAKAAAQWARGADRLIDKRTGGSNLYMGVDPTKFYTILKDQLSKLIEEGASKEEIRKAKDYIRLQEFRLNNVHPAQYPTKIVNALSIITNKLKVDNVLDIFAGVGGIGKIKNFGFKGNVIANELEGSWKGIATDQLHRSSGVDQTIIGDARKIDLPSNSIDAIVTSPTYGNRMGALANKSNYASFTNDIKDTNTGSMVWGPKYEQLHKEAYTEAYRLVKPGGYFILNMKDWPKGNDIPEVNSTVRVKDKIVKATEWHDKALEEAGFKTVRSYKISESDQVSSPIHAKAREFTTGYENIVILQKEGGSKVSREVLNEIDNSVIKVQRQRPARLEATFFTGIDPTQIKRLFKGFHGTSSKYIKPAEIVGKYLEPKSLKRIIEDVLDEVGLKGNDRDKARQQIYKDSYFEHSIKGREGSRSFDKGEVYITNDFESASEYAQWAGEAYDNALSALIDDSIIGKKAKEIYEENREATPYILELNYNQPFKKGDNISETPIQVTGVYDAGGVKLYSGLDAPEATKKIIAGAKALAAYTAKARGMKDWKVGAAADSIREELIRSGVDRSGNIRKKLLDQLGQDGYEIIQKMYLSKGASSLAAQQLKQMRKEVYEGLNKNDKRILDNLILADRMLDIGKYKTASQFKFPEGLSPTESAAYNELFQFTEKITPEKADLLKQKAQAYFEWMKRPLKDMLDAELITQEEYDALASHNYRRLKLVDVFDKRYQTKVGKTKRTVYDSGVESLSHGRETDVFEPSSEVMALEVFNRAYGRILNNAANKTLLDLAREQKDNPFVKIKENKDDHIPSGWDRVFVYDKGERKALYLSPEMTKEWITNNPEMSYKMSQFIRYASGSPVLRTFATGIDWGFALANLPRDIMHTWFAARVFENGKWKSIYSSNTPIFSMQMAADQAAVFSDALLRKGRYIDYIKEGGGMEFLVHQGRIMQRGRHLEGNLDQVQDFLGYFGETTEIMTRLAIRERVIKRRAAERGISYKEASKNKKITQEATFAARDYMDFGQGGGVSKALDNGIPYLNASIQGMRGVLRAFKYNPVQSTYKVAQFAALVTGIYIANNQLHPETMKALKGNASLQNNLIIPIGDSFGFLDEKGQKRYPFIKIPLDQELRFFKAIFEASTDKWLGNEVDVNTLTNTLTNLSPVGISSLPPTASGTLGYMTNKNFWQNEDIWKKTDKSLGWPNSKEEYIPGQTPQGFIDFGAATGMSPERTKYAVQQLVTSGSLWSQLVGAGYEKVFGDLPNDKKEMHLAETLSKMPVINRFFGITNPYSQYAESIKDVREEAVMKRWIENRGLDAKVESYLYEDGKKSDVVDYIKKTSKDLSTEERLQNRFEFQEKIKGLSNRSFWLALKGIPDTDARAELYVKRLNEATPEERNQLRKEEAIIEEAGGIISDEFREAVMSIRYKQ